MRMRAQAGRGSRAGLCAAKSTRTSCACRMSYLQAHPGGALDRAHHLRRRRGTHRRAGRRVRQHGAGREHAGVRRLSCSTTTGRCFWWSQHGAGPVDDRAPLPPAGSAAPIGPSRRAFSRVTATLAESVNGIREIQGFARQRRERRSVRAADPRSLQVQHGRRPAVGASSSRCSSSTASCSCRIVLVVGGYQALVAPGGARRR